MEGQGGNENTKGSRRDRKQIISRTQIDWRKMKTSGSMGVYHHLVDGYYVSTLMKVI
jgi:hypothetical protein